MTNSTLAYIAGGLALLGGFVALAFPLPAGLAVTTFTGAAFLIAGALGLYSAFANSAIPRRGWVAFFSAIQIVLGVAVLANPLAGLVSLTILAGAMFFISGIVRLVMAWRMRNGEMPVWMLALSGLLSLGLAAYVMFSPETAIVVLLGTLLAVELISAGVGLIALGLSLRQTK